MTKAREIAELGQKLTVDASGNMEFAGDLELGDNNKAIFGAGSDLQIYHDGSNSYISDQGTGDLYIASDSISILNAAVTEFKANFTTNGAVDLFYDGSKKLATTSTGVDITGTLTSDGLTVDANVVTQATAIQLNGTSFADTERLSLDFSRGGNQGVRLSLEPDEAQINGDFIIETGGFGSTSDRLRIEANGDISFYEDTGSTAKFFWDASAERLGIGTSSPATELDVNGTTTSNQYLLDNIASTISDTAVDVFVYDTSKDSDGGAWRKRTQGTSWYNEAASSTRGSRKEFPAVAVIVAETTQLTIYDGDDPDLPMWMVFNGTSDYGSYLGRTSGANVTAVHMLNGILCVSRGNSGFGEALLKADFIKEFSVNYAVSGWLQLLPISGRNEGANSNVQLNYSGINPIVNIAVNDVAMTVLPNAPIDSATGLPVPTIAVATDAGTSVIKDDGTVVDITRASSPQVPSVDFYNGYLVIGSSNVGGVWYYDYIPSSDEAISPVSGHIEYYDSGFSNKDTPAYLGYLNTKVAGQYIGTTGANNAGLTAVDFNKTDYTKSSTAFITSTYNTGHMVGDIKLATLSDTDDTDVTGSELVTNGTFDSDTSGWTNADASSFTHDAGEARVTSNSSWQTVYQAITTVVGKTYVITADVTANSNIVDLWIGTAGTGSLANRYALGGNGNITGTGPMSATITATSTTTFVHLAVYNGTADFDNVTARLAEEDRSVNGSGLQVFGSITKDPVASGADLVAYSGFSGSNKLAQPYNSDLNWGSGDFSIMLWVNTSNNTTSSAEYYLARGYIAPSWTNHSWYLRQNVSTNYIEYAVTENGFSTRDTIQSPSAVALNTWTQICVVKRGSNHEMYFDGRLVQTASTTRSHTNADNAPFVIGDYGVTGAGAFLDGSIALVRLSATAPSPEQIAKIYEDEKVLFQENAQATLYGSSDAVTALAYDDSTELLHVGTSAGRSVFQGLRRVDNTTDAVGAAISASNGLVAED